MEFSIAEEGKGTKLNNMMELVRLTLTVFLLGCLSGSEECLGLAYDDVDRNQPEVFTKQKKGKFTALIENANNFICSS